MMKQRLVVLTPRIGEQEVDLKTLEPHFAEGYKIVQLSTAMGGDRHLITLLLEAKYQIDVEKPLEDQESTERGTGFSWTV